MTSFKMICIKPKDLTGYRVKNRGFVRSMFVACSQLVRKRGWFCEQVAKKVRGKQEGVSSIQLSVGR